jgi:hypothetical protein
MSSLLEIDKPSRSQANTYRITTCLAFYLAFLFFVLEVTILSVVADEEWRP